MINEENPLDYFKNLTSDSSDHIMSLQDMEKTIKFYEEELAAEDKRVEGTDEYPNYGDDFADMVYIARRLLDHVKTQKQEIKKVVTYIDWHSLQTNAMRDMLVSMDITAVGEASNER